MTDSDIFYMKTRIRGIKEELRMLEQGLERVENKKDKIMVPEEMVNQILNEIQVKTKGFTPVKWKKRDTAFEDEWTDVVEAK